MGIASQVAKHGKNLESDGMCGIGGIVKVVASRGESLSMRCSRMADRLHHRGPDSHGIVVSEAEGVGLVHTRLSIIDLSSAGNQPMHTDDGRFSIVFNGEIYNYRELREELIQAGVDLRSHSDTEVLLHLYRLEGSKCFGRLVGMYAFAVWDRDTRTLALARGPFGIKPLYYWECDGQLAFASEIRALLESELGPRRLSDRALYDYLLCGSPQEPDTLIEGIRMVPPGECLIWRGGKIEHQVHWQIDFPESFSDEARAIDDTSRALEESVERHFVSDVPVGIFLSGGLDSTALLALAKRRGKQDIHTFCLSFDELEFNEGDIASRTAKHFGATHHEMRLSSKQAAGWLSDFAAAVDQPSIDGFNTYCVSRFAKECGMKVVLSGLGGDELFGSYPSFQLVPPMMAWHRNGLIGPVRKWLGAALSMAPSYHSTSRLGRFLCSGGTSLDAYLAVRSVFTPADARRLVRTYTGKSEFDASPRGGGGVVSNWSLPDQVSYWEMTRYMLNQLLRDSDVMSMANGLELRVPFLDRRLFETLSRVSSALRLTSKKRLLASAVPEIPGWVLEQPKRGFAIPFERWMNEHWRNDFAELGRRSPVRLQRWYHKWSLYTLEAFIGRTGAIVHERALRQAV